MQSSSSVFIVGPMGAGKTTVGKRLAELRGLEFVDSDQEVERRTGVDIAFIFEKEGEEGFRRREKQVIAELTSRPRIVLATGGGAVLDADNRQHLAGRGFVVYLNASVEQQLRRIGQASHRPQLQGVDRRETLEALLAGRDPLYREIADFVVETGNRNARLLAQEIEQHLQRSASTGLA